MRLTLTEKSSTVVALILLFSIWHGHYSNVRPNNERLGAYTGIYYYLLTESPFVGTFSTN